MKIHFNSISNSSASFISFCKLHIAHWRTSTWWSFNFWICCAYLLPVIFLICIFFLSKFPGNFFRCQNQSVARTTGMWQLCISVPPFTLWHISVPSQFLTYCAILTDILLTSGCLELLTQNWFRDNNLKHQFRNYKNHIGKAVKILITLEMWSRPFTRGDSVSNRRR